MGLARMLGPWRRELQALLPNLHGHQRKAIVEGVVAMVEAGHCQLSRMACAMRREARVPSSERRLQRLVANGRLDVSRIVTSLARSVLSGGGPLTLILDETPQANHLRAMKLCRQMHGRALPVLWSCYRPEAPPRPMDLLIFDLLKRSAELLPQGVAPTLLADRGLAWPAVVDFCVAAGWHYVMRIQHHTRVLLDDGRELQAGKLVRRRGESWFGTGLVFKKAHWRRTNLVAYWGSEHEEPWLLITDLPPNLARCRQYAKRMHVEQCFRDEKSHGLQWNQSHIRDPRHANRLLLLMALALRLLVLLGQRLLSSGQHVYFERQDRRTLSVVQLALRAIHHPSFRIPLRP
jgi:hypothetical protein